MKNQKNKKNIAAIYPLSPMQQGMLFHSLYAPESGVYVEQMSMELTGDINVAAFADAWQKVIDRYSVLRTLFVWENRQTPLQIVLKEVLLPWQNLDWRELDEIEQQQQLKQLLLTERKQGFDFNQAPLMKCILVRLGDDNYKFIWSHHHILMDGWCLPIIFKDVLSFYEAQLQNVKTQLPTPRPYSDYIAWLNSQDKEAAIEFWQTTLQGFTAATPLVVDKTVSQSTNGDYDEIACVLSADKSQKLGIIAQKYRLTLSTIVQAAWALLLSRYSGESDVVFGVTVSGRPPISGVENMVGLFINTLPLRVQVPREEQLISWLEVIQQSMVELQQYSYTPLVDIQGNSQVNGGISLFESIVVFENYPVDSSLLNQEYSLQLSNIETVEQTNYPLTVVAIPGDELSVRISYDTARFDEDTIERMLGHLQNILSAMVENPSENVGELTLLSESERHQLLVDWNDTAIEYPSNKCIHQLFEEQVEKTPNAIAVVFEEEELTYEQLNKRANQLAHYLLSLGVKPEVLVGICVERSVEMVVGLLGIFKAGGAYVPMDPNYPPERLSYMLTDSGIGVLVTQNSLLEFFPSHDARVVCLDSDWQELEVYSPSNSHNTVTSSNLAYVIYTSGSTGKPKGVTVEHRQVINFFTGIDHPIDSNNPGTWLALTTICFDISVLELFWTLSRGFQVIIAAEQKKIFSSTTSESKIVEKDIDFSLFYFASDATENNWQDKYKLLIEGAKFADSHGFSAVWTPERHFHDFGGLYPNPSVVSAAIATLTENISIRAGSVVLPLHDEIRVAEEWAVVDNLSHGRVGISFASGWQPNDFVLAPENYQQRKAVMLEKIETVRKLWRGESIGRVDGNGKEIEIEILPRPVQKELPTWITAAGNPETFKLAGELGVNVLTHLLGQTIEELGEKIRLYRQAWRDSGHCGNGHVTIMVHTFIGDDLETVRHKVYQPLSDYLRSSLGLMKNMAISMNQDPDKLTPEDWDTLVAHAFNRYFETSGLLGTKEKCFEIINQLKAIDIDEVGCLIDFGVDADEVISSLNHLNALKEDSNQKYLPQSHVSSISELISKHNISHLQCTPSLLKMLPDGMSSLKSLQKILVGGEKLPISLAKELSQVLSGEIYNMYGPTEATIWSTFYGVKNDSDKISIGKPIVNIQIYILDSHLQPVPVGVPGELYIGGDGLARGYLNRPQLTEEKFRSNPFNSTSKLYKTGDLARYLSDGNIEFLGRIDNQVKIRGFRIELGEIEAALTTHPQVNQTVVIAREENSGNKRLVAYIVAESEITTAQLREYLKAQLPDYMVPSAFVTLESLPLTPNGKIDRKALPAPDITERETEYIAPRTQTEEIIASIFSDVLGVEKIGINDNFFELGGHSLLATQLISRLREAFSREIPLRELFSAPTVASLEQTITQLGNSNQGLSLPPHSTKR